MDLKMKLEDYKNNSELGVQDHIEVLLADMFDNIGHPDPELRDKLIYSTLHRWVQDDILSEENRRKVLKTALSENYLFYKIGERNTDSVFTRSFSSLAAALIIEKDTEQLCMPKEMILDGINKSIRYLNEERDTRGFVQGKGWAHSIAHGADLLTAAINHPSFETDMIPSCLNSIASCYEKEAVYIDDEDERLIFALEALLAKGLTEKQLDDWIVSLNNKLKANYQEAGFSVPFFRRKKNFSDLLKSLYFRLEFQGGYRIVQAAIAKTLKEWHDSIYKP